jgi:ABC-2 type transport system ATP-binding protein
MQEVEAVCDHLVILDRGDIKAQGPINEVLTIAKGGQIVDVEFFAEIENRARVEKELGVRIKRIGEHEYRVSASQADDDIRLLLFRYASQTDNPILEMRTEKADLERVFHEVTTKTE